jgi:inorganic pyrophosphatase
LQVFVENEAGSAVKNLYDQHTLTFLNTTPVSLPYPYPYGFVIGTVGGDGDAVDCFVLTESPVSRAETIDCTPLGLLEQVEDGETDHKVLAAPVHEHRSLDAATITNLETFIRGVFAHVPGKTIQLGRLLGPTEAAAYVTACREEPPSRTDRLHS